MRYVHLNPVRAGIVKRPEEYFWSGHRTLIGLDEITWMTEEWILRKFHPKIIPAREFYKEYVDRGIRIESPAELRTGTHHGVVLGSDDFAVNAFREEISLSEKMHEFSLEELIEVVSIVLRLSPTGIKGPGRQRDYAKARAIVGLVIKNTSHLKLQSLADLVGKGISSISRQSSALELQLHDQELLQILEEIKSRLKAKNNATTQT